jgi:XTP/dITP diphosphohydrolase
VVEGEILTEKRGTSGFGYDPVFQPSGFVQTFAEMNLTDKNKISHRGRAVEKLIHYLKTL